MIIKSGRPASGVVAQAPLKHVIEEYRHRDQLVTCVCGWQGSTESVMGSASPWTTHVRESKAVRSGT